MDKLPFFYYDILSRITPGAATLATLFLISDKMPPSWHFFFVDGQQNWKAVVVPLVLGGLCYVIGVLFEGADYAPVLNSIVRWSDAKAFKQAWKEFGQGGQQLEGWTAEQIKRLRFHLWETLVFKAGSDAGTATAFSHCHRFQAEYKMFLHLMYPALLFGALSTWRRGMLSWYSFGVVVIVPALFYLSHLRNRRRWLQTVSSCRQLNIVEASIRLFSRLRESPQTDRVSD